MNRSERRAMQFRKHMLLAIAKDDRFLRQTVKGDTRGGTLMTETPTAELERALFHPKEDHHGNA